jgi:hypothetical protein
MPAEITELRLAGCLPQGWTAVGEIEIVRLGPGVRAGMHRDIRIVPMAGAT